MKAKILVALGFKNAIRRLDLLEISALTDELSLTWMNFELEGGFDGLQSINVPVKLDLR